MSEPNADGHDAAPSALRARVPRANSITIVAMTNAENVYATRPGIELPAPSSEQHDAGGDRHTRGPAERRREARERRAAPRDERPDPHQEKERQAEGAEEEVVVRAPEDDRLTAHCFREHRVDDAPENREAERKEQQVVVEKRGLP